MLKKIYTALFVVVMAFLPFSGVLSGPAQELAKLNKHKHYEEALELLLKELEKHPKNSFLRAEFRKTLSLHVYEQISAGVARIRRDPHDTEAYLKVARAYYMASRPVQAMEILNDGVTENPSSVALWMSIGWFELQAKRPLEALSVFREVVRLDNKNAAAHHHMAYLMARPEDGVGFNLSQALTHAQIAVEIEPRNVDFINTLSQIHQQLGQNDEAITLLKKALVLAPDDEELKDRLVQLQKI